LVTGAVSPGLVRGAAIAALVCCVPLSLANGWVAGLAHLGAVGCGLAYDAGLKSGIWSGVPYAVSFGLQVVFVSYGGPLGGPPSAYVVVAAALLAVGAHLTNAVPDLDDDAATGVRGLPHRLGPRLSVVAAAGCFVASVGLVVGASQQRTAPATLLLAAVAVALAGVVAASALRRGPGSLTPGRWLFRCAIAVGAIGVALLVLRGGVR
jgi:4-hydroxybenzoate polyprenyltransferase